MKIKLENKNLNFKVFPSKKRFIFTLVTALIGFMFCLLLLEVLVRSIYPKIDLYRLTGRIPGPNPISLWADLDAFSAYRAKPGQYADGKTVNKHGFISTPEITVVKTRKTFRVVFLGGSATAGTGWNLNDEQTWPWQTVKMLRMNITKNIDFINGALPGYTSFESYGRLWSRLLHFSPDIVVLYHGWNEMYYFNRAKSIISWRTLSDGSWSFKQAGKIFRIYDPNFIDPLIRWSQVLTRFRLSLSEAREGEIESSKKKALASTFDHKSLDIWRTNLKLFRETCNTLGIKLFVAKQATLIVPDLAEHERRKCRVEFHGMSYDAHLEAFQALYKIIDEEIPSDSIIDVTTLSGNPDFFFDHVHPTPEGAKGIASIVFRALSGFIANLLEGPPIDSAKSEKKRY